MTRFDVNTKKKKKKKISCDTASPTLMPLFAFVDRDFSFYRRSMKFLFFNFSTEFSIEIRVTVINDFHRVFFSFYQTFEIEFLSKVSFSLRAKSLIL